MSFGQNLQFLRKMRNGMTQEALAEKLNVSRQTVSKWEQGSVYPEMDKLLELRELFSCTLDELVAEDMSLADEHYSDIRCEWVEQFRYIQYAVVSIEPEDDAKGRMERYASMLGISEPRIIGWDFPVVSQEQINVYNMHGYAAALILDDDITCVSGAEMIRQERQRYAVITIKQPFEAPFHLIPNAYKTLMAYMNTNSLSPKHEGVIPCFEKEYIIDGIDYMDVYIAIE